MNNRKSRQWLALLSMVIVALLLATCAPADSGDDVVEDTSEDMVEDVVDPTAEAGAADGGADMLVDPDPEIELSQGRSMAAIEGEEGRLRMGLLPILDVLPFFVAEQEGIFEMAGITVELVPVSSALERDQLMQSGEIDGMLNDLISTGIFNQEESQIVIVSTARKAYPDFPQFRIVAGPESGIATPADLAGVPVGISENSVIEYTTDRLLEAEGLTADDIVTESVPSIPNRFQLLMEGQLAAANLPDPLAQGAIEAGAILIVDDTAHPEFGISVLSFSADAAENKQPAIRRFLAAWNVSARAINADPESYRALLLENIQVPESIQDTYTIPEFPTNEVPTEAQWDDVVAWLVDKEIISGAIAYGDAVTDDFVK